MSAQDGHGPPPAEDTARPAPPEAAKPAANRWRGPLVWGALGLALVVLLALVVPVVSTLQPGYYRRYPALAQRMDHWATSTHSRISCIDCHVDPGLGGFTSFAVRSIPAFYSQLVSGPSSTNLLRAPDKQACQKCHTAYRQVSPGGDLLIPHRAHVVVLGMECRTCHRDLVHSVNRRGFNRPEMEWCLTCHNGDKATDKCVKCHTRKQTPPTHARKDWLQVHGRMATTVNCAACHDWTPDFCGDCHKRRPASHVANWKATHGPEAKRRGAGCLVCHGGEKFCKRCH